MPIAHDTTRKSVAAQRIFSFVVMFETRAKVQDPS